MSIGRTPPTFKAIFISIAVHATIFVLVSVLPTTKLFFNDKPVKVVWVSIPKGTSESIEIGLKKSKDLPQSTIQQQKRPKKTKQERLRAKKMKEPASKKKPRKKPKKKLSAIDRKMKNALAKIDKNINLERSAKPEAAQIKEDGEGFKYGTGDKPLKVMPDNPEFLKYQAMIKSKIINEWIIPLKYVEDESINLSARIEVMIDMQGNVVSTMWDKPSGDASFDASAMRSIKKASPLPKPPDKLAWEAYNEGFLVEFDPKMKR